eukprot:CAMPEP_0179238820 /NCGR_PEP_ID=MMETSP0797-20121207/15146_1 /TAXON_ID=47934 /ORGANISM="Dinophysis acuminata, Strain DAEP01" /LENGTH=514 /DNA_ID=CAMNT_0020946131 /DNA_START=24 /DNA_END=1569 /DNA_ORIENTATION=-
MAGADAPGDGEGETTDAPEHPLIKMCVIGETGAGKSSLCNALVGAFDKFPVSDKIDACTFTTKAVVERFLGRPHADWFTMVDTPGLNDPRPGADNRHLSQMTCELMKQRHMNAICLVLNGDKHRLPNSTRTLMRLFSHVFGGDYWKNVMVVYTHWSQDARSKRKRGPDKEQRVEKELKELLMQSDREQGFGLPADIVANIPCFFIDTGAEVEDEGEHMEMMRTLEEIKQVACTRRAFQMDSSFVEFIKPLNALEELCVAQSRGGFVELHGLYSPWLQDGDVNAKLQEDGKLDELDTLLGTYVANALASPAAAAVGAAALAAVAIGAAVVGPVGWGVAGAAAVGGTVAGTYLKDLRLTVYISNLVDQAVFLVGVEKSRHDVVRAPRVIPSFGTGVVVLSGSSFDCRLDYKNIEDLTFSIYGACGGTWASAMGSLTFAVRANHHKGTKSNDFGFERERLEDTFSAWGLQNSDPFSALVHVKPPETEYHRLIMQATRNAGLVREGTGEHNVPFKKQV